LKATARAFAIQGLVKYHGLRDPRLRLPYHDSISVCMRALPTITTVEMDAYYARDEVNINGRIPSPRELDRVEVVLDTLRHMAAKRVYGRVVSRNPEVDGKGLGFSASGFAALGLAAATALGLDPGTKRLSEIVRLGAGSASRSLVGGFSIWYASRKRHSYAEQVAKPDSVKLRTIIAPVKSALKTDTAHKDSVSSPMFKARLRYVSAQVSKMKRAIAKGDVPRIGAIAEEDTLNLHAVTMTGPAGIILITPVSLAILHEVRRLREEDDVPAWFSLDTGPSVFINTLPGSVEKVKRAVGKLTEELILSAPGGAAEILDKHLF